ncbi:hypothetical protein MZM54_00630 [[Brevibacterium] frigoritolerans]|nr:hypothetical protein [Peribacillus frigoritolerans]
MKLKKSDWTIVREAEQEGLAVGMTGTIEPNRTELNKELSEYFRKNITGYSGSFGEDEGEDILYSINSYMKENNIDKYPLDFPMSSGTDIHLIPIGENIQLKVVVADEYYGDGDYAKYVMIDFFLINETTTKQDVDVLIEFVGRYLNK